MKLYDDGYSSCPCFWGNEPATLVQQAVKQLKEAQKRSTLKAIDLGCGEGKNAAFAAQNGFTVLGIDQSEIAIQHALNFHSDTSCIFLVGDMQSIDIPSESFELVISTGSIHCLDSEEQVSLMIGIMIKILKQDGLIAFSSFNDRSHDFSGHAKNFNPILLSHDFFIGKFSELNIISSSDKDLEDIHPNNKITHKHSITRILAKKS